MDSLKMLFPVILDQLQSKPDRDNMALMGWIQERSLFTSAAFFCLNSGNEASMSNHGADPAAAATAAAAVGGVEGGRMLPLPLRLVVLLPLAPVGIYESLVYGYLQIQETTVSSTVCWL